MLENIKLFKGLNTEEIEDFLKDNSQIEDYDIGEYVFEQGEEPKYLYILLNGVLTVERTEINGKRTIVNQFREDNTVFGEVYLYVESREYDYSAVIQKKSKILKIKKEALLSNLSEKYSERITNNMLTILSNKAFYLNQKLLIFSSYSLKQKLAKFFLLMSENNKKIELKLNREELAGFLGVARPSVSRELMNMQDEGLIKIDKNKILLNKEKLENFL